MKYLKNLILLYSVIVVLLLSNIGSLLYFLTQKEECICKNEVLSIEKNNEEVKDKNSKIKVDIKGYIKKPGVYELDEGAIINDLIKLAGGIKKNGTTDNINLSKKLRDETMIVVLSKSELKKQNTIEEKSSSTTITYSGSENNTTITESSEVSENDQIENTKVSINNASQTELMTLSGIGEKTALKIIEYRTQNPFKNIEDIKNVSGIGDALFEKIKDFITI